MSKELSQELDEALHLISMIKVSAHSYYSEAASVQRTLEGVKAYIDANNAKAIAAETALVVPNEDWQTSPASPWVSANIDDELTWSPTQTESSFTLTDLVSHTALLTALASPAVGTANLARIWEGNITDALNNSGGVSEFDEALKIAENNSGTGLGFTTLSVLSDDGQRDVAIHILVNMQGKGMIVGDDASSGLREAFAKNGIKYIARSDADAKRIASNMIYQLTAVLKPEAKSYLQDAFAYRNDVYPIDPATERTMQDAAGATVTHNNQSLPELLVDGSIAVSIKKFVLKNAPTA